MLPFKADRLNVYNWLFHSPFSSNSCAGIHKAGLGSLLPHEALRHQFAILYMLKHQFLMVGDSIDDFEVKLTSRGERDYSVLWQERDLNETTTAAEQT